MIPAILFVYKRIDTLKKTLSCLKANKIPLLIIYSDGAKGPLDAPDVESVRALISQIDWCQTEIHCRKTNLGLGRNIMLGVTETLENFDCCLVFEDDLIFVPGTYDYLCAALEHYKDDPRVYSVTGWTNKCITPPSVSNKPYFDGRAECMTWGVWRRSWQGMTSETALEKMNRAKADGIDPYLYGGDLPYMAKTEQIRNIWAVRLVYHHIVNHGLCLRPPWSMVNHIGWGLDSSNAAIKNWEDNGELMPAPVIPQTWPEPTEEPGCASLIRKMYKRPWVDVFPRLVPVVRRVLKALRIIR